MSDSPAARLKPSGAAVLRLLLECGRVERRHREDVAAVLGDALEAFEGRSRAAKERNAERAEAIRASVREAAARLAIERPSLNRREQVSIIRKQTGASLRVIREEIKASFSSGATREPRYSQAIMST